MSKGSEDLLRLGKGWRERLLGRGTNQHVQRPGGGKSLEHGGRCPVGVAGTKCDLMDGRARGYQGGQGLKRWAEGLDLVSEAGGAGGARVCKLSRLHKAGRSFQRGQRKVKAAPCTPSQAPSLTSVPSPFGQSGKLSRELDFVSHHVRTKLDELKRQEVSRLRMLLKAKMDAEQEPSKQGWVELVGWDGLPPGDSLPPP